MNTATYTYVGTSPSQTNSQQRNTHSVHTSKNIVLQGNADEDGTVVSRNEIASDSCFPFCYITLLTLPGISSGLQKILFSANKCVKISSGDQPCQCWIKNQRFAELLDRYEHRLRDRDGGNLQWHGCCPSTFKTFILILITLKFSDFTNFKKTAYWSRGHQSHKFVQRHIQT
jgi:hypothetical protein